MMVPQLATAKVCVDGAVATLSYNKPHSGNSLNAQTVKDMFEALKWADNNPDIQVIVQTGEGRFFSTGMELGSQEPDRKGKNFSEDSIFYQFNKLLILSKKILIAAVNGPAAGYGVSSLALFDLVYSVPDAYFFTPFVKWGMTAEGTASVSFPRIMGHQKAAALFLAAERMTATELERLGLITKILPKDNFREQVDRIAKEIAKQPPGALQATKELMKKPVQQDLLDANDRECAELMNRVASDEPQIAMQAFITEREQRRKQKDTKL